MSNRVPTVRVDFDGAAGPKFVLTGVEDLKDDKVFFVEYNIRLPSKGRVVGALDSLRAHFREVASFVRTPIEQGTCTVILVDITPGSWNLKIVTVVTVVFTVSCNYSSLRTSLPLIASDVKSAFSFIVDRAEANVAPVEMVHPSTGAEPTQMPAAPNIASKPLPRSPSQPKPTL